MASCASLGSACSQHFLADCRTFDLGAARGSICRSLGPHWRKSRYLSGRRSRLSPKSVPQCPFGGRWAAAVAMTSDRVSASLVAPLRCRRCVSSDFGRREQLLRHLAAIALKLPLGSAEDVAFALLGSNSDSPANLCSSCWQQHWWHSYSCSLGAA